MWPKLVDVDDVMYEVTAVVAGEDCSLLVTASGILLAAGSNRYYSKRDI